jgi:hypothetical protein
VHLVHLGHGTLQVIWALVFFCVSLLSNTSSFIVAHVLEEVDRSLLFSPIPSSLGSRQVIMAFRLRENGTSLACSLSVLVNLHDARIGSHEPWCLLRMS